MLTIIDMRGCSLSVAIEQILFIIALDVEKTAIVLRGQKLLHTRESAEDLRARLRRLWEDAANPLR